MIHHRPRPGGAILVAGRIMKNLSDLGCQIAIVLEMVRQGYGTGRRSLWIDK
ncbi:hypothetical protein LZD49_30715 [Dyadobacter sp. CY261]|nr:hypothetical protein [Dyadobacter sp. CY261]